MADERAYITLNSKPYKILLDSYRDRDLSDFSPRASIPGGGVVFSEMNLYQPINQTDWRHGFGHNWHDDAAAYWTTEGNMETRIPGVISLGGRTVTVDCSDVNFIRVFDGKLHVYLAVEGGGLYKYTPPVTYNGSDTLTALPFTGKVVNQVWTNGTYDFVLVAGERLIRVDSLTPNVSNGTATGGAAGYLTDADGGYTDDQYNGYLLQLTGGTGSGQIRWIADTVGGATQRLQPSVNFNPAPDGTTTYKIWDIHQAGTNTNSTDYNWMTSHDGYVFAGKNDTNQVYYGSDDELDDMHGDPTDDPAVIKVGKPGAETLGAISYNGNLIIFKEDGLYKLDADRSAARKIVDYSDTAGGYWRRGFTSWAVYNGTLVYSLYGHVYQWNGARVSEITPPIIFDGTPMYQYESYRSFVSAGNYLFVIARDRASTTPLEDLIAYDGVGWHRICQLWRYTNTAHGADNRFAMIYRAYNTCFIVAMDHADPGTYDSVSRIYEGPYGLPDGWACPYQGSGTNTWISSRYDAGFRRVQKSTPSIFLVVNGTGSYTGYVDVYYRLNDGSWTAWGGTDGVTNRVETDGVVELTNPLGAAAGVSTLEYYWIQLKLKFVQDANFPYVSPQVEDVTLRVLLRPDAYYGYNFTIVAAKEVEDQMGATDTRDVKTIIDDLRTARDSKAPIDYIDPFGISRKVYISSMTGSAVENHVENIGAYPDIEEYIQINLVEVTL